MKNKIKKGFVLICLTAILLAPFISACGKKAPPKPPTKESGDQNIKKP
jgi:hypothetical protein